MKRIDRANICHAYRQALHLGLIDPAEDSSVVFLDFSVIEDRIRRLARAFPKDTLHAVAIKTNPLTIVLRFLAELGVGLEAASWPEVLLARNAGLSSNRIVFDSPAKTTHEIQRLSSELPGLRVNADSLAELQRYSQTGSGLHLGLRINPLVSSETLDYMNVGGVYSKFGEPLSNQQSIIEACRQWQDLDCLHIHIGSQISDCTPSVSAIKAVLELAEQINHGLNEPKIKLLNIGGGFPVNYHVDQPPFQVEYYAQQIRDACPELFAGRYQLMTEFGRYVHANACWAISDIEYVKPTPRGNNLINHLGADMFIREAYNPGDWYHEMFVMDASGFEKAGPSIKANIAGPLCFGGDFVGLNCEISSAEPGNKLVVLDVGANTFSLWSRHCSRPFPKVISCSREGNDLKIAKQRESIESIIQFWS